MNLDQRLERGPDVAEREHAIDRALALWPKRTKWRRLMGNGMKLDLSWREKAVFAPLLLLVFWMGVYPSSFLVPIRASVDNIVQRASAAQKVTRGAASVIPAKAGTHLATAPQADEWIPASAGLTSE